MRWIKYKLIQLFCPLSHLTLTHHSVSFESCSLKQTSNDFYCTLSIRILKVILLKYFSVLVSWKSLFSFFMDFELAVMSHLQIMNPTKSSTSTCGTYRTEYCANNLDVSNFLDLTSLDNHDNFCLAFTFTYRDFSGGTLGLAWVATEQSNLIC